MSALAVAELRSRRDNPGLATLPPPPRPLQRPLPLSHPTLRFVAFHPWLEAFGRFPLLRNLLAAGPDAGREAGEVSRAEGGGIEDPRPHDGDTERVRLEFREG